ncbi:MAG: response regulator transcription factor [Erysipelotrichaceae bacterium]|nr:response regulator transcription factor [Erysipelotrichaceae bacterium]MDY5251925.1 response regulator transcription factor [Erysipelotrichaceae bacterium]
MQGVSILIVEDDLVLAKELQGYLTKYGYNVILAERFDNILEECQQTKPDLLLMDINLPYFDGFYWCNQIREYSQIPLIYISSRNDDQDKIMGIAQGGDDYVEKPFNLTILKAKIEAIIRRTYQYTLNQKQYIVDNIYYDVFNNCLFYHDIKIELTKSENIIIKILLEHKNKIVSRNLLMDELWSTNEFISDNTLTVLISRLRTKLKDMTGKELIKTKKGQGYYI